MTQLFKALLTEQHDDGFVTSLVERDLDALPEGDLLIRVAYSCLNYKDALSADGNRGVTRQFPHTPGIDAAGVVEASDSDAFSVGEQVIVTGYDLGMNTDGGLAEYIRIPSRWAIKLPVGLSLDQSMMLGTAGLTAGLCVKKLQQNGVEPGATVLVTGASGGVGSIAVTLLASQGYRVVASTGKSASAEWLRGIGADEVVDRATLTEENPRPLLAGQWDAAIDTVGGNTLACVLKMIRNGGSVACCGLAGGDALETTVFPFIIRGINLLGVDSVEIDSAQKQQVWQQFAGDWRLSSIQELTEEVTLEQVPERLKQFLTGSVLGRILVKI